MHLSEGTFSHVAAQKVKTMFVFVFLFVFFVFFFCLFFVVVFFFFFFFFFFTGNECDFSLDFWEVALNDLLTLTR